MNEEIIKPVPSLPERNALPVLPNATQIPVFNATPTPVAPAPVPAPPPPPVFVPAPVSMPTVLETKPGRAPKPKRRVNFLGWFVVLVLVLFVIITILYFWGAYLAKQPV